MKIDKREYEELVRDSEKLRVIESLIQSGRPVSEKTIMVICGYTTERGNIEGAFGECAPCDTAQEPKEAAPPPKRKRIDRGKVRALHDAGWSNVKIADEMGCAESSISMILKEYNE